MKILKIYLFLFLLLNCSLLGSQTYIAPIVAIENLSIFRKGEVVINNPNFYVDYFYLNDQFIFGQKDRFLKPFYHRSYLFDLRIIQKINDWINISFDANFTKKKYIFISAVDCTDVVLGKPLNYDIRLKKIGLSLGSDFFINKYFYCKTGLGIDRISIDEKINFIIENSFQNDKVKKRLQMNFNVGIGYLYKNLFLELNYVDGFSNIWGGTNLFHPVNSINLGIGYRLMIYPIKSNKKVDCPKF